MKSQILKYWAITTLITCLTASCTSKPAPTEVVIALDSNAPSLTQATILVDYSRAAATPVAKDGKPSCTVILPNVDAEFTDDGAGTLTIEARSGAGFSGPVDLAVCRMTAESAGLTSAAIAEQLAIKIIAGTDTAGQHLDEKRLAMAHSGSSKHKDRATRAEGGDRTDPSGVAGDFAGGDRGTREAARTQPGSPRDDAAQQEGEPSGEAVGGYVDQERLRAFDSPTQSDSRKTKDEVLGELDEKAAALAGEAIDGSGEPKTGPGETSNDDTDTDRQAIPYAVTVGVTSSSGQLAALQFDIRHTGSSGGWLGAGGRVVCTQDVPVALATFNDRGGSWLSAAMVDLAGFPTPGAIATCTFKTRDVPEPNDFQVQVLDASTDDPGNPPDPFPQMAVINIQPLR